MKLVDIEKLEYETFMMESGEFVDYISANELWAAPKVDPVNHAKWVLTPRRLVSDPDEMFIEHECSHCGYVGKRNLVHVLLWNTSYQSTYKPELNNYCGNCGYKMDLDEIEEQYKTYKSNWCVARGYILEAVEEKGGINGECYACFDEWYDNEYQESRGE